MQQIFPAARACTPAEVYAGAFLERERGCVAMNVVTSVDGLTTLRGTSKGLGSRVDRMLMRSLRAQADAVLTGVGTLRLESVSPGVGRALQEERVRSGRSPQPLTVVMAGKGKLVLPGKLRTLGPERLIAFLPSASESHPLEECVEVGATVYRSAQGLPHPTEVVHILREQHQVKVLLIEGGPKIYEAFLAESLVDEVFWTIAPKLVLSGETGMVRPGVQVPAPHQLRLISAFEHEGELYLRYAMRAEKRTL